MKLQTLQILQILIECRITVGCRLCAYPSIHFFVSRSRSVVDCALCGVVWCVRLGMRKTPPCVDSKRLRVCVLNAHTEAF